jgi:acyl-CoA reductase-like NAD-dependent aldehyde dehydrogenase
MKTRRFQMLVGGRSVDAESGETISRESPAYDGLITSEIPRGSFADAEKAILAARHAFDDGPWPKMTGQERSRIMHGVADTFAEHAEELALIDALDGG